MKELHLNIVSPEKDSTGARKGNTLHFTIKDLFFRRYNKRIQNDFGW